MATSKLGLSVQGLYKSHSRSVMTQISCLSRTVALAPTEKNEVKRIICIGQNTLMPDKSPYARKAVLCRTGTFGPIFKVNLLMQEWKCLCESPL